MNLNNLKKVEKVENLGSDTTQSTEDNVTNEESIETSNTNIIAENNNNASVDTKIDENPIENTDNTDTENTSEDVKIVVNVNDLAKSLFKKMDFMGDTLYYSMNTKTYNYYYFDEVKKKYDVLFFESEKEIKKKMNDTLKSEYDCFTTSKERGLLFENIRTVSEDFNPDNVIEQYESRGTIFRNAFITNKSNSRVVEEYFHIDYIIEQMKEKTPVAFTILSNVCGDDIDDIKHFLNWNACKFNTRKKIITSPLLYGDEGTGKNLMTTILMNKVFDSRNIASVGQAEINSSFNSYMVDKIYINFNEVELTSTETINKIKAFITEPSFELNEKGIKAKTLDNRLSVSITTNSKKPLTFGFTDRRYILLKSKRPLSEIEYLMDKKNISGHYKVEWDEFISLIFSIEYDLQLANSEYSNKQKDLMIDNTNSDIDKIKHYMSKRNSDKIISILNDLVEINDNGFEVKLHRMAKYGIYTNDMLNFILDTLNLHGSSLSIFSEVMNGTKEVSRKYLRNGKSRCKTLDSEISDKDVLGAFPMETNTTEVKPKVVEVVHETIDKFDSEGYDEQGYDKNGLDRNGEPIPF